MNRLSSMRRLQRCLTLPPVLALLCLLVSVTQAHAACGAMDGFKGQSAKMPMLSFGREEPLAYPPSVIGLWHAIYTNSANNEVFNDSFKSWHIDGTEVESAFLSPAGGNVCMGVWKSTSFRTVELHHTGWLFNAATPTATATNYFTVDESVTVAPNGKTYSGTFTFKVWNLDGSATPVEIQGTITATRIAI
ncbi:hypothetical protein [Terriglobus roseus]|uniref:Lipocalin-like domain-containing protein n=1 Tax=Terriglobus roseus TaxID=392734 RepID=A0A1G7HL14_9BACT|nr:hypothetical protein [Terriglobus roseus]SDF01016.1 hypothetical protein SAMN05444167_1117 [Terriglobus roseus]